MKLNKSLFFMAAAALMLVALPLVAGVTGYAADFTLPGNPVPPTACRQDAVLSTDQFTSTGIPQVRTVQPNETVVAGAWVLADGALPETSVIPASHCPLTAVGRFSDGWPTNVIGMKLNTSIGNAKDMDLQELDLYWDVNLNAHLDPGLDLLMQVHTESDLTDRLNDENQGIVWYNGPESPIFVLSDPSFQTGNGSPFSQSGTSQTVQTGQCTLQLVLSGYQSGLQSNHTAGLGLRGQGSGYNFNGILDPCAVGILAVVKVGPNPKSGADFALQLQAKAADIPGAFLCSTLNTCGAPTSGQPILATPISSEFAPEDNPQASNILLVATGGHASTTETPVTNISNGSGAVESDITTLNFTNLKTRFRADPIVPGTRDAIDIAVAICDGSAEANNSVTFLPPIAGAPPTIAGGLAALPCIASAGSDGFDTGVNGAVLIFSGPGAQYIRNVRMWVDTCPANLTVTTTGSTCRSTAVNSPAPPLAAPNNAKTQYGTTGGGDGILFQANEQIQQVTPRFNPATGEAIAIFGHAQEQIFEDTTGLPVAAIDSKCAAGAGTAANPNFAKFCTTPAVNPDPTILVFTSDIGDDAIGATVNVRLGLQVGDDTSQTVNGLCALRIIGPLGTTVNCASNLLTIGPEVSSFDIVGPTPPPVTPPPPPPTTTSVSIEQALDVNHNNIIDDSEIIAAVGYWTNGTAVPGTVPSQTITDQEMLKLAALWTTGNSFASVGSSSLKKTVPSLWEQILNFFSAKPAVLSGTQVANATQVNPGGSFEVTVNVKANQPQGGLILSEKLPAGWTATPVVNGSAYAKANEPKWLWLGARGQTSITYRVTVPGDASQGAYQISGALMGATADQVALAPLAINVAGETQALSVESVKAQELSDHSLQFTVSGSNVAGLQVQIFDLSGKVVFNQTANGTTLTFRGLGADGQTLANGVYLYAVTVQGISGQSVTTQVKKLVVLR